MSQFAAFSQWFDNVPKLVFSRTLSKVEWKNARLVKDTIVQEISSLKQQEGLDMLIMNSTSLAQSLQQLGLVDEYRLGIYPVVLGGGKPLFQDSKDRIALKLLESETFPSGVVLLTYQTIKQ